MSLPQAGTQSPETPVVRAIVGLLFANGDSGADPADRTVDVAETDQAASFWRLRESLSEVQRRAVALHPDTRLGDVLKSCSALLGDRPVTAEDPDAVVVAPGSTVEFLPPFAGG